MHLLSVSSQEKQFNLALACPLSIKKSLGLQRGKNDRIDARRIAEYAYVHQRQLKTFQLPDDDLVNVRDMLNLRGVFVKYKVSETKLIETAEYHYTEEGESPCLSTLKAELEEITAKIKHIEKEISEIISCALLKLHLIAERCRKIFALLSTDYFKRPLPKASHKSVSGA